MKQYVFLNKRISNNGKPTDLGGSFFGFYECSIPDGKR
jgi:hypothetical protein